MVSRMSYHGKLQVLKNGTADAEIQLWAYQQLEKELDCYGDGNVYGGVRSKNSEVKTYVFDEHAGKQTWFNPTKTLTDKEILEEWDWKSGEILATDLLDFADAILRKAQEK